MLRRWLAVGLTAAVLSTACSATSSNAQPSPAPANSASSPSGTTSVPTPDHVVVVVEENRAYSDIIGNTTDAPYLNSLADNGASFTHSYAETHPSEPNYLALFAGSTFGLSSDACPVSESGANLGAELLSAHKTFTGYSESLPSVGYTGCSSGDYARKHAPWVDFSGVPGSVSRPFGDFPSGDYASLPTLSFVIPNLAHDMHDGSVQDGDSWLRDRLGGYARWARTHNSLLIVTWDEDDNDHHNHIATIMVGQQVKTGRYAERINHYTVLRTLEDMYHLPLAGHSATAAPLTDCWH